jgi:hypothetical protein
MKITSISKLFCAVAICFSLTSLTSFAGEKEIRSDKKAKKEKAVNPAFDAAVFQVGKSNRVKLAVDRGDDRNLRVLLKDKTGRVYYSELFTENGEKYRRVFNFDDMTDGTYYFELFYNNRKLIKEINLQTNTERLISF